MLNRYITQMTPNGLTQSSLTPIGRVLLCMGMTQDNVSGECNVRNCSVTTAEITQSKGLHI
jgi:hypothetical protein